MFAIIRNGIPERLTGSFVDNAGIQHPPTVLGAWDLSGLASISVYPIVPASIPAGQRVVSESLIWDPVALTVTQVYEMEDIPSPPLEIVQQEKIKSFSALCHAEITGGFTSEALGSLHTYSSELEDQINLMGAASIAPELGTMNYVCADTEGVKQARPHTRAQLQQVYGDGATHKATRIYKFHSLQAQIEAAETVEAVEAITWD